MTISQKNTANIALDRAVAALRASGCDPKNADTLPYCHKDLTAGSEMEFQVAVLGSWKNVDLPQSILGSDDLTDQKKRVARGESSSTRLSQLVDFLKNPKTSVWENSWVRIPVKKTSKSVNEEFLNDMHSDRLDSSSVLRSDRNIFEFEKDGEKWIRVPVSYLLNLALASIQGESIPQVEQFVEKLKIHFLNDNTSPESTSFHVMNPGEASGRGIEIAREASFRFLFSQLLVQYANQKFGLLESGQKVEIFFQPHPAENQKSLNRLISDNQYRELFCSPCLSGWQNGEKKAAYMRLCHEVLSRSHLNIIPKIKDAGILKNNLVVLPSTSSTSLSNNGIHLTLGSKLLTEMRSRQDSGFGAEEEKSLVDLVSKVVEHFLGLFVGYISASPYRLDFKDFHPEVALGFLPHQLTGKHLRMIWRRWRVKAKNRCLGRTMKPYGPYWIDRIRQILFRLKGDHVPDYRLIDYPISFLSTEKKSSQNGLLGNHDRLKGDLERESVFDSRMSMYLPFKPRSYDSHGFVGIESRIHSLFPSFKQDFALCSDLLILLTAFAHQQIIAGRVNHDSIPDDPDSESERRQLIFASALGLPTAFIRPHGPDLFMGRVLAYCEGSRRSYRYKGKIRVSVQEYLKGCLKLIKVSSSELISHLGMSETIQEIESRIDYPRERSSAGRITGAVLKNLQVSSPMNVCAQKFNQGLEEWCRGDLCNDQLEEAFEDLRATLIRLKPNTEFQSQVSELENIQNPLGFVDEVQKSIVQQDCSEDKIATLISLMILVEQFLQKESEKVVEKEKVS